MKGVWCEMVTDCLTFPSPGVYTLGYCGLIQAQACKVVSMRSQTALEAQLQDHRCCQCMWLCAVFRRGWCSAYSTVVMLPSSLLLQASW